MTETHDKLRGLFLTTLMVLSIFAGTVALTGTAAAIHGNVHFSNRGATPNDVSPLDSRDFVNNSYDFRNVKINFSGTTEEDMNVFDGSFSQVKDGNVVIKVFDENGDLNSSYRTDAVVKSSNNNNSITVGIKDSLPQQTVESGMKVKVNLTDNFENPSDVGNYTGGSFIIDPAGQADSSTGKLRVFDTEPGVGEEKITEPDVILVNNSLHYIGQRLVTNGTETGVAPRDGGNNNTFEQSDTPQVEKRDSQGNWNSIGQTSVNSSGFVVYDTDDLSPGHYRFRGQAETTAVPQNNDTEEEIVKFELIRQNLNTSFEDSTISTGGSTVLRINSSNRASYRVHITSADLGKEDIQRIFTAPTGTTNTTKGIAVTVSGNDRALNANFETISKGSYTFDVDVIDTIAKDTAKVDISDRPPKAELAKGIYEVPQGDLVQMTVNLQNTDDATIVIGGPDDGYETTVSIEDGNDDDTVTFIMNTYLAGRFKGDESNAFSPVDDQDTVTANLETDELDEILDQADYALSARTAASGETDVGTLVVRERSTKSINISTAPRSEYIGINDVEDFADIPLTNRDDVANGDIIVHKVQTTGVFGAVAAADGEQTSVSRAGFLNLVQQNTLKFSMVQQNPDTNTDPKELELDESIDNGALKFIPDEDNGTLYVLVRSGTTGDDAHFFRTDPTREDVFRTKADDEFESEFNVSKNSLLVEKKNESVNASVTIVEPEIEFETDNSGNVTVWSPDNTDIQGTSSLAPGTEFTVRARATGNQPFLKTAEVTVSAGGTFTTGTTLDFSDVEKFPTLFTASVQTSLASAKEDGRVIARPTATVTMNDQTVDAGQAGSQTLTVASVTMNYGGFVTIHDQTLQDGQTFSSVRGSSDYLTPGSHSDVQVRLSDNIMESQTVFAMPHQDTDDDTAYTFVQTNGAEDGAYTEVGGGAVTDSASITVETPTATPTETPTPSGPTPTETPQTPSPTPTESPTPTTGQTPGFGITVAVISLAAAALLARRRLN